MPLSYLCTRKQFCCVGEGRPKKTHRENESFTQVRGQEQGGNDSLLHRQRTRARGSRFATPSSEDGRDGITIWEAIVRGRERWVPDSGPHRQRTNTTSRFTIPGQRTKPDALIQGLIVRGQDGVAIHDSILENKTTVANRDTGIRRQTTTPIQGTGSNYKTKAWAKNRAPSQFGRLPMKFEGEI